jgi:hypothetical protein
MRSHSIRWWVAGVMLAGAGVASAATVTADFNTAGSLGGGVGTGSARNSSVGGDGATDGLLGFNNFSGSNFAVIGDNTGDLVSPDALFVPSNPTDGSSSLSFSITITTLSDLAVSFKYKFQGWDLDANASDQFQVTLTGQANPLVSATSTPFGSILAPFTFASGIFNGSFSNLAAGTYTLAFVLNEASGSFFGVPQTNTAVAIDDVSLVSTAVPVPVPAAAWLLGSALLGVLRLGRRRR